MKWFLLPCFLFFLFFTSLEAQSFSKKYSLLKKRDIIPITCAVLGGMSNGINRAYTGTEGFCFERKWGVKSTSFFGSESWKRKYKNYDEGNLSPRFIGSTTFLVSTTNINSLTSTTNKGFIFMGTVTLTLNRKSDFFDHIHRFLFTGMVYSLSSWATHSYLTKDIK